MAGDWLKVEKDTPEKPEVLAIAERLGVSPEDAFGRCFKVWRWADSQTQDGVIRISSSAVDTIAGLAGFSDALREVGWLQVRSGSLEFPNFDRHMGQPAKKRSLAADRQRNRRHASVTRMSRECNTPSSLLFSGERENSSGGKQEEKPEEQCAPSQGVGVQGAGGNNARDGPPNGMGWPQFLATEWCFYFSGVAPSQRDVAALDKFFVDLARNVAPEEILSAIRDKNRSKREPTWEFERRWQKSTQKEQAKQNERTRHRYRVPPESSKGVAGQ